MNPQKTIINGSEYEIVPAEVIDFDYVGISKERLYSIKCKLIGAGSSQSPQNVISARALDANIKNIPISGEIVLLLRAPSAYNNANLTSTEYYYTNPVSIQSSVHHNGLPGATDYGISNTPSDTKNREETRDGITNKTKNRTQLNHIIDPTFPERLDVYPIQPYSGDIILEGRWGQSIRFGSTVDERRNYSVPPSWKSGFGATGNPITIISNGTNPSRKQYNQFILENVDTDDSCIWLTSGQEVHFTPASTYLKSISDKGVELHTINNNAGHQVIIASDRIVLNAKKQEIIGYSKEGIGFSTEKIFSLDSKKLIEMESERINLGLNATEPVLLGDTTATWLGDLCVLMEDMLNQIANLTVTTGVGPSGVPINSAAFRSLRAQVSGLSDRVDSLKSRLVFLNKNTSK
jgi:hypothetical protein